MRNAPVTTASLLSLYATSALSSFSIPLAFDPNLASSLSSYMLREALTLCAPLSPVLCNGNYWNLVSFTITWYHLRKLERVLGSASFCSLFIVSSFLGMLQGMIISPGNGLARIGYAAPWTFPMTVLAVRYMYCLTVISAEAHGNKFSTFLEILKQHGFFVAFLGQLWLLPAVPPYVAAGTSLLKIDRVSLQWRTLELLVAVVFGAYSCRPKSRLQKIVAAVKSAIAEPLVRSVLRPLMHPICGSENIVQFIRPARAKSPLSSSRRSRSTGNSQVGSHQRVSNLARGGSSQFDMDDVTGGLSPNSAAAAAAAVDPSQIALLREFGIDARDEEIIEALFVSNGNLEQAAAILMDRR